MKTTLRRFFLLLICRKSRTRYCFFILIFFLTSSTVLAQPANDNCAAAVVLTPGAPGAACAATTPGTLVNATNSGVALAPCTAADPDDDVWYRFTATSTNHTITLGGLGSNITGTGGGARLQLFSGACGSLTTMACGTTTLTIISLLPGTTYYLRVFTVNSSKLTSNGAFNICITTAATSSIDFGKSYINISKPGSGTVEPGDILEIRASVVVKNSGSYDSCSFRDIIPTGTSYIPGTLRVLTNEGKIYKQFTDPLTDAANDEGWIAGTTVNINLGYRQTDIPGTKFRRGRIAANHKPSFYSSTCIMMASYRVTVTAPLGGQINVGGGSMTYTTSIAPVSTFTFPSNRVAIYSNFGMCANAIGANSLGTEFNGTFGSGPGKNRGTSANVPPGYTYDIFTTNGPNDYYYGVSNNTSTAGTGYTTLNTWPKPDGTPNHRVFGVWDIIGDHTGAASPTVGNPATDTVANKNGGYMLVVNAAYRIDSAFQQTISNLCPNTYYEISCWMRNICSKCGCDSNGKGASQGAGYIATALGDSSGVYPNVTFEVDGLDYYSTGNLTYTGQWVKKGFTILTGPSQTSFTLKFFNNAPGGGGNDWALDDITVATCLPNMKYSPSITPTVCIGNALQLRDTVRSYFNNYRHHQWQVSNDGGLTWSNIGAARDSTPYWNATLNTWEYVSRYTIPVASLADNGKKFRVVVATTPTNLSNINCRSTDATSIVTLNVLDCGPTLDARLISFNGIVNNKKATLKWTTTGEKEPYYFDVEKSSDGTNFNTIATVSSYADYTADQHYYTYTDPAAIEGKVFYRINMRSLTNSSLYSKMLTLSGNGEKFALVSLINPFRDELLFDISSSKTGIVKTELINAMGNTMKRKTFDIREGVNQLSFDNTGSLPAGIYILKIEYGGTFIYKNVMKQN